MKPVSCVDCGSAAVVRPMGLMGFMAIPQCLSKCKLHKQPKTYCGGSVSSMCRSGICDKRDDAVGQWNRMQERTK